MKNQGEKIITQGEAGDMFYITGSGTCDISVNGNSVMTAEAGIAFGELALLHNAPRAATVTATTPVQVWALDEISFKMILMGKSQTDHTTYKEFLTKVPILANLTEMERQELAGNLKEQVPPRPTCQPHP